ncbi:MAG: glycosyltransferase family 4 protein [Bacteroidota bacterium]
MNILQLCNKSPWPPKEGGPIAMHALTQGLTQLGHTVDVLAMSTPKYPVAADSVPDCVAGNFHLVKVNNSVTITGAFANLFSSRSYHVTRFVSKRFEIELVKLLQSRNYDIVQLETIFVAPYIDIIRKYSTARIVLRAHNIEHLIWERIAKSTVNPVTRKYIRYLSGKLSRYELSVFKNVDAIAAISPQDEAFIKSLNIAKPLTLVPFGVSADNYQIPSAEAEWPSLFHLGSMDWFPNQEGMRWFITQVWPLVQREYPEIKLYLAGRNMPKWLTRSSFPGVSVIGEVPDAAEFMASKGVMIVPLFSGSGVRIKIIEGMALAKPVISTTIGAEGINCSNGENIILADDPISFVREIRTLTQNREKATTLGLKARELILREHNADIASAKLATLYEMAMSV